MHTCTHTIHTYTYRRASTADHSGHYRHYEHTTTQSSPRKIHRQLTVQIRRLPCRSPRCNDSRTTHQGLIDGIAHVWHGISKPDQNYQPPINLSFELAGSRSIQDGQPLAVLLPAAHLKLLASRAQAAVSSAVNTPSLQPKVTASRILELISHRPFCHVSCARPAHLNSNSALVCSHHLPLDNTLRPPFTHHPNLQTSDAASAGGLDNVLELCHR